MASIADEEMTTLPPSIAKALDELLDRQPEPKPSRSEAIRIALRDWLTGLGLLKATDEREDQH